MADNLSKSEMSRRKVVAALGFFGVIAVLLLAPYHLLSSAQQTQENLVIQVFGVGVDHWLASFAGGLSQHTGLLRVAQSYHGFLGHRLDVIDLGLYIIAWRFMYALMAIMLTSPLLIAAVYDGMMRRRISQWRYEYTSNRRHYFARAGAGLFADGLLFLVVFPIPLSPLVIAMVMFLFGVSLNIWAASIQKRM